MRHLLVVPILLAAAWSGGPPSRQPLTPRTARLAATDTAHAVAATVPMRILDGRIVIDATIDGHTGAWLLDLSQDIAAFNGRYLHATTGGDGIDGVPDTAAGGADQVPNVVMAAPRRTHTVAVGAVDLAMGTGPAGVIGIVLPNTPHVFDTASAKLGRRVLGSLGASAFANAEFVLDYRRGSLTIIRLDASGRRAPGGPSLAAKQVLPLVRVAYDGMTMLGVQATLGDTLLTTLVLATSTSFGSLAAGTRHALAGHLRSARAGGHDGGGELFVVDQLRLGTSTYRDVKLEATEKYLVRPFDILGNTALARLGVVGFNYRTNEFAIYK